MRRVVISPVTDGIGAATAYSPRISGLVHSVTYVKRGSNGYANGVSVLATAEATGEQIWSEAAVNATATRHPRGPTHSTAGAAALYAAGGAAVQDAIGLGNDRIKVVIAGGGDTKGGDFHFVLKD